VASARLILVTVPLEKVDIFCQQLAVALLRWLYVTISTSAVCAWAPSPHTPSPLI